MSIAYKSITITINFVTNSFRDWYPLGICDHPNNYVQYKNKYLFDVSQAAADLKIYNLKINNYIINDNRNYPIVRLISNNPFPAPRSFVIVNGSFINISSFTTDSLFYGDIQHSILKDNYFNNISTQMIFHKQVKHIVHLL